MPGARSLNIIDRKKDIFKLGVGEYVSPVKLEGVLSHCRGVGQIVVHGDSDRDYVVALVARPPLPPLPAQAKAKSKFARGPPGGAKRPDAGEEAAAAARAAALADRPSEEEILSELVAIGTVWSGLGVVGRSFKGWVFVSISC